MRSSAISLVEPQQRVFGFIVEKQMSSPELVIFTTIPVLAPCRMPFTYPDDLTMNTYQSYETAKAQEHEDPPGLQKPAPGTYHDHDEDEHSKIDIGPSP